MGFWPRWQRQPAQIFAPFVFFRVYSWFKLSHYQDFPWQMRANCYLSASSEFPPSKKRGPKLAQCYGPRFLFRRKHLGTCGADGYETGPC